MRSLFLTITAVWPSQNDKVTVIESSKGYGLYSRFAAADWPIIYVMHCDDDLFVPEETVNTLMNAGQMHLEFVMAHMVKFTRQI